VDECKPLVLGSPYGMPIDMWSLGCVAAELFLGRGLHSFTFKLNLSNSRTHFFS
jgi:dual specificity protein kinase YAK1